MSPILKIKLPDGGEYLVEAGRFEVEAVHTEDAALREMLLRSAHASAIGQAADLVAESVRKYEAVAEPYKRAGDSMYDQYIMLLDELRDVETKIRALCT